MDSADVSSSASHSCVQIVTCDMLAIPTASFTLHSGATVLTDPRVLIPEVIAHGRPRRLVIPVGMDPSCAVSVATAVSETRNHSRPAFAAIQERTGAAAAIPTARIFADQVTEDLRIIVEAMPAGTETDGGMIEEKTLGQTSEEVQGRVRSDLRRPNRATRLASVVVEHHHPHRSATCAIRGTRPGCRRLRLAQAAGTAAMHTTTADRSAPGTIPADPMVKATTTSLAEIQDRLVKRTLNKWHLPAHRPAWSLRPAPRAL